MKAALSQIKDLAYMQVEKENKLLLFVLNGSSNTNEMKYFHASNMCKSIIHDQVCAFVHAK
jgi:hypothetical protein